MDIFFSYFLKNLHVLFCLWRNFTFFLQQTLHFLYCLLTFCLFCSVYVIIFYLYFISYVFTFFSLFYCFFFLIIISSFIIYWFLRVSSTLFRLTLHVLCHTFTSYVLRFIVLSSYRLSSYVVCSIARLLPCRERFVEHSSSPRTFSLSFYA